MSRQAFEDLLEACEPYLALVARLLIAVLFLGGTMQKLVDPSVVQALLAGAGMPEVLVWPAAVLNGLGAASLILGVWVRPMALLLAGYCLATSYFHGIQNDPWQLSIMVKNWAIAGGCIVLALHGSGRIALRPD